MSDTETAAAHAYGLRRPDLDEARAALERVFGEQAPRIWVQLLERAGLTGAETTPDALERLLDVMRDGDSVTALCARALTIRSSAFTGLSAPAPPPTGLGRASDFSPAAGSSPRSGESS